MGETANYLEVFLTSNPSIDVVFLSSPLGSSTHNIISLPCPTATVSAQDPQSEGAYDVLPSLISGI